MEELKKKKILKRAGYTLLFIVFFSIVFYSYGVWLLRTGRMVKYNGKMYTRENYYKVAFPDNYEAPAKNTPEEVYKNFRAALLTGDTEKALTFMKEKRREEYRGKFKNKNTLEKYKIIPDISVVKKSEDSNSVFVNFYYYLDGNNNGIPFEIKMEKNINGFWEIDFM